MDVKTYVVVNVDTGRAALVDATNDIEALSKASRWLSGARSVTAELVLEKLGEDDRLYGQVFGYDG